MIAVDTSTLIAFLRGDEGADIEAFAHALKNTSVVLPPPVLVEALSNHATRAQTEPFLKHLQLLTITEGFWLRAADLRATLLSKGLKCRIADTLIAQCCLDHRVPLITRDKDFRHYAEYAGLILI